MTLIRQKNPEVLRLPDEETLRAALLKGVRHNRELHADRDQTWSRMGNAALDWLEDHGINPIGSPAKRARVLVSEIMRAEWPANGGDGPALIATRPVNEQPKIKIRQARAATSGKREQPFLLRWRREVYSASGPLSLLRRTVLNGLSLYAKMDGTGAFPSQARLAVDTFSSLSTVRRQLRVAIEEGWIRRSPRPSQHGECAGFIYTLLIPIKRGGK